MDSLYGGPHTSLALSPYSKIQAMLGQFGTTRDTIVVFGEAHVVRTIDSFVERIGRTVGTLLDAHKSDTRPTEFIGICDGDCFSPNAFLYGGMIELEVLLLNAYIANYLYHANGKLASDLAVVERCKSSVYTVATHLRVLSASIFSGMEDHPDVSINYTYSPSDLEYMSITNASYFLESHFELLKKGPNNGFAICGDGGLSHLYRYLTNISHATDGSHVTEDLATSLIDFVGGFTYGVLPVRLSEDYILRHEDIELFRADSDLFERVVGVRVYENIYRAGDAIMPTAALQ